MAEIHTTSGKEKILSYNDFIYSFDTKNGINYSACKVPKCPGQVISFIHKKELKVRLMREHNHSAQPAEVEILRMKSAARRKALEKADVKPQESVRQEFHKLPAKVKSEAPGMHKPRRIVKRYRFSLQKNSFQLLVPKTYIKTIASKPHLPKTDVNSRLALNTNSIELLIPETHLTTISTRPFLLHDNIINNEVDQTSQRTIVFATKENLRLLFNSDTWYVDRTFDLEGTLFLQMWAILAKVNELVVPLAYILMQTRHEDEYLGGLLVLQQKAAEHEVLKQRPSTILTDVDEATVSAVKSAFPKAHIGMSLFRFQHTLHSKIQVLRLHDVYTDPVKRWLCSAIGLAYVPPADVAEAFQILLKKLENDKTQLLVGLEEVASYLDTNYIRGNPQLRELPRYPIEMWNIYERTLSGNVLSDTCAEQWYRKFGKTAFQCTPGSLDSLMDAVRTEQNNTEVTLTIEMIGAQFMGKQTIIRNERIRNCAGKYQEFKSARKVLTYMRTIGSYNFLPK